MECVCFHFLNKFNLVMLVQGYSFVRLQISSSSRRIQSSSTVAFENYINVLIKSGCAFNHILVLEISKKYCIVWMFGVKTKLKCVTKTTAYMIIYLNVQMTFHNSWADDLTASHLCCWQVSLPWWEWCYWRLQQIFLYATTDTPHLWRIWGKSHPAYWHTPQSDQRPPPTNPSHSPFPSSHPPRTSMCGKEKLVLIDPTAWFNK